MADQSELGRVAELSIALSLATDLGTGQPMEHGLRTCAWSLAAAEALGMDPAARSTVYHVALLRFIGCLSDAADTAELAGGDDLAFNAVMAPMLAAGSGQGMWHFVRHLAEDLPGPLRAGRVVRALADPGMTRRSLSGHCEVGARLATRLGMAPEVRDALAHAYERWDGKGFPSGLAGEEIPAAVRVVSVTRDAELWDRAAGWAGMVEVLRRRRGHAYDPAVVDAVIAAGEPEAVDDRYAQVLADEPEPVCTLAPHGLDDALGAIADFADLKSPWFRDHSTGVARLATAAALAASRSEAEATTIGRAALVHDVGRAGVPNGIWDRPGPLTADQWERVRLHPYLTERVLRRSTMLAPFAAVAARHHERVDGSGYHRGDAAEQLEVAVRLLGAADAYHAMTEARSHRPAMVPADAAGRLLDEADAGRFTRAEVDAVLDAAGQAARPAAIARPAGLTEREVDVLRLIARGQSNRQVAAALGLSPKTVGHHVEHLYAKAGVRTRAGATLFAMEHDLL